MKGKLKRRRRRVVLKIRIIGRNEIGKIEKEKDLERWGIEDGLRRREGIEEGKKKSLRRLKFLRKVNVEWSLMREMIDNEGFVKRKKWIWKIRNRVWI